MFVCNMKTIGGDVNAGNDVRNDGIATKQNILIFQQNDSIGFNLETKAFGNQYGPCLSSIQMS